MPIRPRELVDRSRPDNTQYVSQVERANGIDSFTTRDNETLRFLAQFFHPDSDEFPWAGPELAPGERVFLNRTDATALEAGTIGQPITFSNPITVGDGIDLEVVQDYIDVRGDVELVLWGTKPSATPPFTEESQYEPIAPVFYDGASGVTNIQRVAEPTKRSLLNPQLQGEQAVAATVENVSGNTEPIRGKIYVSVVVRDTTE